MRRRYFGTEVSKTIGAASTVGGTSVLIITTSNYASQAKAITRESNIKVELD